MKFCGYNNSSNPVNEKGYPRSVMVKSLDCVIVVSKFGLQSRYYVHFQQILLGKV